MNDWREEMKSSELSQKTPIKPQALARAIGEAAKDDAIFICDTGAVTVRAARHLPVGNNQRFTLSSTLASMGFGLPGAIGAQLAFPERQVIAICGDGGFAMLWKYTRRRSPCHPRLKLSMLSVLAWQRFANSLGQNNIMRELKKCRIIFTERVTDCIAVCLCAEEFKRATVNLTLSVSYNDIQ